MAGTMTPEQMQTRLLREIAALRREIREIAQLINADVRTADRLIGVGEACKILGRKKSAVYAMIASGQLPARREDGGRYKLSFNQLQKYIQS